VTLTKGRLLKLSVVPTSAQKQKVVALALPQMKSKANKQLLEERRNVPGRDLRLLFEEAPHQSATGADVARYFSQTFTIGGTGEQHSLRHSPKIRRTEWKTCSVLPAPSSEPSALSSVVNRNMRC
jgi:hypothetical protein